MAGKRYTRDEAAIPSNAVVAPGPVHSQTAEWTGANGKRVKLMRLSFPDKGSADAAARTVHGRSQLVADIIKSLSTPPHLLSNSNEVERNLRAAIEALMKRQELKSAFHFVVQKCGLVSGVLCLEHQVELFRELRYVYTCLLWLRSR